MNRMMIAAATGLVLTVALAAGCDKKVKLTFTNVTQETRPVEITAPGLGTESIGVVGPSSKLKYDLKISKDELPANCAWQSGELGGGFTVTNQSPKELWIDIGAPHGPRDKHTEIKESKQVEIKDQVIDQYEVVE